MRLTPAEVHNVTFKKPSIGKRGYDEDEVDAFLDLVEDELARLIEENNALTGRLAEVQSNGSAAGVPVAVGAPVTAEAAGDGGVESGVQAAAETGPVAGEPAVEYVAEPQQVPAAEAAPAATAETHVQAARMLGLAQEMADRLTAEARAEADRTLGESRAESERLRAEAAAESERLRSEAVATAEATERDARERAEARELAAQQQYEEVVTTLTAQRTELQKKIDDLRSYEREYRSRLRSWINDQLAQLDGEAASVD
jgi:DivIVA domain-containing protein